MRHALAGAIGGLGATLLMSAVMLGARRLGLTAPLPPDKIAERVIETSTDRPSGEDEERVVASVLHLGFGTMAGTAFGILLGGAGRAPAVVLAGIGAVYATGIWLVSYQGWVPGLRIMPPATRDDRGRVATMIVAHWVYGIALGLTTSRLRRFLS
ncbi:MAG: hypothetical protein LC798_14650 [Chloroflexi bacterium]|nr:hypothetical protein [Chloroflexota bacterium]